MKFWFISYSPIWVFGKCHSFNILRFYTLKSIEIKTLKIILIHFFFKTDSSAKSHKTPVNNPASFCTGFLLLLHWFCSVLLVYRHHSTGIHSGNVILLKFIINYLCVQLAGWSPCSTAAFSAGKPNASHPIGFITCQQKGNTQSHRPPNNVQWCCSQMNGVVTLSYVSAYFIEKIIYQFSKYSKTLFNRQGKTGQYLRCCL